MKAGKQAAISGVVLLGLLLIYLFPNEPPKSLITVGGGVVLSLMMRNMYSTGAMQNPLGEGRDFSGGPVLRYFFRAGLFALIAMIWAAGSGLAIRFRLLPCPPPVAYSLALGPILVLLVPVAVFLLRGILTGVFGNARR